MSNYELIIYHGAGSVTYTADNTSRIVDRQLEWHENYPKTLTITYDNADPVATQNILSSTCAIWDTGTGAVELGDQIKYSQYPTSTGVKTQDFYGKITKLKRDPKTGYLIIQAKDYLEYYEATEVGRILYKNYRDSVLKKINDITSYWEIQDVTDSDILLPMVKVEMLVDDKVLTLSTAGDSDSQDIASVGPIAQPFYAAANCMTGVVFSEIKDVGKLPTFDVMICNDDGGEPDTSDPVYSITDTAINNTMYTHHLPFQEPVDLVEGRGYWIVFQINDDDGSSLKIGIEDNPTYYFTAYSYYSTGAWHIQSGKNISIEFAFAAWQDVAWPDYQLDTVGSRIVVLKAPGDISNVNYTYSNATNLALGAGWTYLERARVHYYYNTQTLETLFDYLLEMSPAGPVITSSTSSSLDRTLHIYRTQGKTIGNCLRELADVFETSGTYSGRQHSFGHYEYGGYQNVRVGFQYKTSDSSSFTFSHGRDSTTDNELRIIDVDLEKDAKEQVGGVTVIGKSPDGYPICAHRDDRALSTSMRNKVGFPYSISHTDDNLQTLSDVDVAVYAILDSGKRDVWEGSITVSGVYSNAEELDNAGAYFGSGKIITLNYSPLGISATKFKVTGYICYPNKTQIFLSNRDFLKENWLTRAITKSELSSAFQSPEDLQTNVFYSAFVDEVVTTASLYMELSKSENTPIDGHTRVLCTKLSNTDYNLNVYHAEFEADNGYTIDGTSLVAWINLYDASSGGSKIAGHNVPSYDEFPKWKTTRIIVDLLCKAS